MTTLSQTDLQAGDVRVWDPFVRLFHWGLATAVLTCLLTGDDVLDVHVVSGYAVGGLVLARVLWGVAGPAKARFADFVYRPSVALGYLRDLALFRARRYVGHSPAGGAMVVALLVTLAGLAVTGMAAYGAEEQAGAPDEAACLAGG